jgi:AraC-like DNA-binding protein
VSPAKLHQLFRAELRTTPAGLLQEFRLEQACRLLVNSDAKTSEIASRCGFSCLRTFQRAFAACYGQHPTQWRGRPHGMLGRE